MKRPATAATLALGVEIGGTKLQAGLCDQQGRLKQLVRVAVARRRGRAGILAQLSELLPPLLAGGRARAIGVGFGGPVDLATGRIVKSHQITGWDGFALRAWFARRFGLPVVIENDSNCAALAEARQGAGRGRRRVLYFNVGTGIGGGFVVAGELQNGQYGATEFGHTRLLVAGRWRTLESVASGLAIERGVSTLTGAARHVGAALANAVTLLNPDVVVIGGGVALAGEKFLRPLRATAKRLVFAPYRDNFVVAPAAFGEGVAVVGAALAAVDLRSC